jgi:hypothetical protein
MSGLALSAFDLPDNLAAKADPALIGDDERHFAAIGESVEQSIADLSDRLDAERKAPGGRRGQAAMDRDMALDRQVGEDEVGPSSWQLHVEGNRVALQAQTAQDDEAGARWSASGRVRG